LRLTSLERRHLLAVDDFRTPITIQRIGGITRLVFHAYGIRGELSFESLDFGGSLSHRGFAFSFFVARHGITP
jgi:hypothetical protein